MSQSLLYRFLFLSFFFLFLLFLPQKIYADAPTATITLSQGQATTNPGQQLTFTVHADGDNLKKMEVYRAKTSADLQISQSFQQIGDTISCSGSSCDGTASWTPASGDIDSWYVVVNVNSDANNDGSTDDPNDNCTGNPGYTTPGWTQCGPDSVLTITVNTAQETQDSPPDILGLTCQNAGQDDVCTADATDPDFFNNASTPTQRQIKDFSWTVDGQPYTEPDNVSQASQNQNVLGASSYTIASADTGDPNETAEQSIVVPLNTCIVAVAVTDDQGVDSTQFVKVDSALCASLLPNVLPSPPDNWNSIKTTILNTVYQNNSSNIPIYMQAAGQTGVPWIVLAAIHYREASSDPNESLVSGTPIGQDESDIDRAGGCNDGQNAPSVPVPGGCGFKSLLDSAIYAGNRLNGYLKRPPQNYQELTGAYSDYNGGGNSNCPQHVPYATPQNCPDQQTIDGKVYPAPLYDGDDDPYATNFFDKRHVNMSLIYCGNTGKCASPPIYTGYGGMTVIRVLVEQLADYYFPTQ